MTPSEYDLDRRVFIDGICDEFEAQLQTGAAPRIEDYLDRVGPADLPALIQELVDVELEVRSSRGETVSREQILQRFPQPLAQTVNWPPPERNPRATVDHRRGSKETERLEETAAMGARRAAAAKLPSIEGLAVECELGRGGMGVVYRARQTSLDRVVAVKMIRSGQLANEEDIKRFQGEAEAAAHLDHPGIVPIHQIGAHEGQHYFVMGYVEGESLAATIVDGPLTTRRAAECVKKVADAIVFAHEHGVIHRDLKPANVLLASNDEPKVTDFGLAKRVEGDEGLTATGQILGTANYMPPEQASGRIEEVAETADIYSLGATLYALITGRPPFQAASQMDTLLQVMEQEPVAPRKLNAQIPPDLETICLKCLEKDRGRRYQSASELADELQRFLRDEPIHARPIGSSERVWRWCRRNPRVAIPSSIAAAFAVTLMIGGPAAAVVINQQKNLATQQTIIAEEQTLIANREKNVADEKRREAEQARQNEARERDLATEQSEIAMQSLVVLGRKAQDKLHKAPGEDSRQLRLDLLNTALAGLQKVSDRGGSNSIISATALRRKGDIYMEVGRFDRALAAYQQCRQIVELTVDEPEWQEKHARKPRILWQNRARANDAIGDAYRALKKPDEALNRYKVAFSERQKWLRVEPEFERAQQGVAVSHGKLGEWHREAGDDHTSLDYFHKELELRRKIYERHAGDEENSAAALLARRELGGVLRDVGVIYKRRGKNELAVRYFNEALPLLQHVLDNWTAGLGYEGEYKMEDNVALCYADLGETYLLEGQLADAIGPYKKAVALFNKLHKADPEHFHIRKGYWRASYGLGTCELKQNVAAAQERFQAALDVSWKDSVQRMLSLARCHRTDEAAELAERFAQEHADDKMSLYYSACGFALCAWSARENGDQNAFKRFADRAVATLESAIAKSYDNVAELKRNPELVAIRDRPEFSVLLEQIEKRPENG